MGVRFSQRPQIGGWWDGVVVALQARMVGCAFDTPGTTALLVDSLPSSMESSRRALLRTAAFATAGSVLSGVTAGSVLSSGTAGSVLSGKTAGSSPSATAVGRRPRRATTASNRDQPPQDGAAPFQFENLLVESRNVVDKVNDLVALAEGGYVVVGESLTDEGRVLWLFRIEPDGNRVWNRIFGQATAERALSGTQDVSGDVALAGNTLEDENTLNALFARVSVDGELVGHETYSLAGVAGASDLALASDGSYRLAGWTATRPGGPKTPAVLRIHPDGRLRSWRTYSVPRAGAFRALVPAAGDGALAVGWVRPAATTARKPLMVRIDRDDREWWRRFDSMPSNVTVTAGVRLPEGGFITGGVVESTTRQHRSWLTRFTASGTIAWSKRLPEDGVRLNRMVRLPSGDVLFGGASNDDVANAWLGQFTLAGEVRWTGTFGPPELAAVTGLDYRPGIGVSVAGTAIFIGRGQDGYWMSLSERNAPPEPFVSTKPGPVTVGQSVAFDARASGDPDGEIVAYDWDLDGDGTFDAEGPVVQTRYERPGEKTVVLRVTDDDGRRAVIRKPVRVVSAAAATRSMPPRQDATSEQSTAESVPGFGVGGAAAGLLGYGLVRFLRRSRSAD